MNEDSVDLYSDLDKEGELFHTEVDSGIFFFVQLYSYFFSADIAIKLYSMLSFNACS